MRLSLIPVTAAFAAVAHAAPAPFIEPIFCALVTDIIKLAQQDPLATPFCSSYLSIGTVTSTATATSTPPVVLTTTTVRTTAPTATITVATTTTLTNKNTATATFTSTSTVLATITASTSTLTCAGQSGTASQLEARGYSVPSPTPGVFKLEPPSVILQVCECFGIPSPTAFNTVTSTLAASTSTVTTSVASTPLRTITSTMTITTSSAASTTTLTTSTTTTSTVSATASVGAGLHYYQWPNNYNGVNTPLSGVNISSYQNNNFSRNGLIQNLRSIHTYDYPYGNDSCTLPGYPSFNCSKISVVFEGYFLAQSAGTYNFTVENLDDDLFFGWTGNNALGAYNWNAGNSAFEEKYDDGAVSYSVTLGRGALLPVTFLYVNANGPGEILFDITTPEGGSVTDTTGWFVPPVDCQGVSPFAP